MTGDHNREAELLDNHMQDLEKLAKMKQENGTLQKDLEQLRCVIFTYQVGASLIRFRSGAKKVCAKKEKPRGKNRKPRETEWQRGTT